MGRVAQYHQCGEWYMRHLANVLSNVMSLLVVVAMCAIIATIRRNK